MCIVAFVSPAGNKMVVPRGVSTGTACSIRALPSTTIHTTGVASTTHSSEVSSIDSMRSIEKNGVLAKCVVTKEPLCKGAG